MLCCLHICYYLQPLCKLDGRKNGAHTGLRPAHRCHKAAEELFCFIKEQTPSLLVLQILSPETLSPPSPLTDIKLVRYCWQYDWKAFSPHCENAHGILKQCLGNMLIKTKQLLFISLADKVKKSASAKVMVWEIPQPPTDLVATTGLVLSVH